MFGPKTTTGHVIQGQTVSNVLVQFVVSPPIYYDHVNSSVFGDFKVLFSPVHCLHSPSSQKQSIWAPFQGPQLSVASLRAAILVASLLLYVVLFSI